LKILKKKAETRDQLPCLVEGCGWAKGINADKDDKEKVVLNVGQLYHHIKKKANRVTPSGIAHLETKEKVDKLRMSSRGDVSPGNRARRTAAAEVVEEGKGCRQLLVPKVQDSYPDVPNLKIEDCTSAYLSDWEKTKLDVGKPIRPDEALQLFQSFEKNYSPLEETHDNEE